MAYYNIKQKVRKKGIDADEIDKMFELTYNIYHKNILKKTVRGSNAFASTKCHVSIIQHLFFTTMILFEHGFETNAL